MDRCRIDHPCSGLSIEHEAVAHPDERGHVLGLRLLEDGFGGVDLLDRAGAHDRNSVAESERLILVMRHVDGRELQSSVEVMQLGSDVVSKSSIEIAQRLIEEHQLGTRNKTPRESHPLLLAAAQLNGISGQQLG